MLLVWRPHLKTSLEIILRRDRKEKDVIAKLEKTMLMGAKLKLRSDQGCLTRSFPTLTSWRNITLITLLTDPGADGVLKEEVLASNTVRDKRNTRYLLLVWITFT